MNVSRHTSRARSKTIFVLCPPPQARFQNDSPPLMEAVHVVIRIKIEQTENDEENEEVGQGLGLKARTPSSTL